MKTGFVGTGLMGSRMAANLLQGGHALTLWNRTRAKAEAAAGGGARVASSPAEAAAGVEVLVSMLADPQAVRQAALGENGFLEALPRGALWVDSSTVNPSFSREMGRLAEARGVGFLDAPVAGTVGPAQEGRLVFFVGGAEEELSRCRPLLELMGRAVIHAGGVGMGTSMKMVVNLMLAGAMAAFSEALSLAEALGLSRELVLDKVLGGPVAAPFLSAKRDKIERGSFEAEFPLKWMAKDLHLASLSAHEAGVAVPATGAVGELYALAARQGHAEEDFSALYAFLAGR